MTLSRVIFFIFGQIARLVAPFARGVVECHPLFVGRRCLEFADRLDGRLQVAMGLETVHPEASSRLNKRSGLDDFRRAAGYLALYGIELRAFVLVGGNSHRCGAVFPGDPRHSLGLGRNPGVDGHQPGEKDSNGNNL